jgi:hypothetical protein
MAPETAEYGFHLLQAESRQLPPPLPPGKSRPVRGQAQAAPMGSRCLLQACPTDRWGASSRSALLAHRSPRRCNIEAAIVASCARARCYFQPKAAEEKD